jgi:hypothetical protein
MAMLGLSGLEGQWGPWIGWVAIAGFLVGVLWLIYSPVNISRCPSCGQYLKRPPFSQEFTCADCSTCWFTKGRGASLMDW